MVVHMYQLRAKPNGGISFEQATQAVKEWASQYNNVVTDEQLSFTQLQLDDGTEYGQGEWRFEMNHTEQNITNDAINSIQPYVKWYQLKYHVCDHDHDEPEGEGCSWDEIYTGGSDDVPSELA